jgi:transposase-like protein
VGSRDDALDAAARKRAAGVARDLRAGGDEAAAKCLEDDLDRCLTFYPFPENHWSHRRTTNVIESPFASVGLRTNPAKRFKKTKSGVYLVFEVMMRLQPNGRRLKSAYQCGTVSIPTVAKKRKAHAA